MAVGARNEMDDLLDVEEERLCVSLLLVQQKKESREGGLLDHFTHSEKER